MGPLKQVCCMLYITLTARYKGRLLPAVDVSVFARVFEAVPHTALSLIVGASKGVQHCHLFITTTRELFTITADIMHKSTTGMDGRISIAEMLALCKRA